MRPGSEAVILRIDRAAVCLRILLGAGIAIGGVFYFHDQDPTRWLIWSSIVIGIAGFLVWPLVALLFRDKALEISAGGVLDQTAGLGFIPWANIRKVRRKRAYGTEYIELELTHSEIQNATRRGVIRASLVQGGADAVWEQLVARMPDNNAQPAV